MEPPLVTDEQGLAEWPRLSVLLDVGERSVMTDYDLHAVAGNDLTNQDYSVVDILIGHDSGWCDVVMGEIGDGLSALTNKPSIVVNILTGSESDEEESAVVRLAAVVVTKIIQMLPVDLRKLSIQDEGIEIYGSYTDIEELQKIKQEKKSRLPAPAQGMGVC